MLLFYPIIPAVIFGLLNWWYWSRKGYSGINQLIMSFFMCYALFYLFFKWILT